MLQILIVTTAVNNFAPIPDLLKSIQQTGSHEVCADARPHPDGIQALFPSDQLSISKSGFVEPLYPPMRSEKICGNISKHLMDMTYLVHDFEAMCRKLKPWSKRILIDMGASLEFHKDSGHGSTQPIVTLVDTRNLDLRLIIFTALRLLLSNLKKCTKHSLKSSCLCTIGLTLVSY